LLSQLAAVSTSATPTDSFAFLRKTGVIDDPGYYQLPLAATLLRHTVVPAAALLHRSTAVGDEVMQRLAHRTFSGANRAAIGSTLFRSPGGNSLRQ
jgi:hypothetical protein